MLVPLFIAVALPSAPIPACLSVSPSPIYVQAEELITVPADAAKAAATVDHPAGAELAVRIKPDNSPAILIRVFDNGALTVPFRFVVTKTSTLSLVWRKNDWPEQGLHLTEIPVTDCTPVRVTVSEDTRSDYGASHAAIASYEPLRAPRVGLQFFVGHSGMAAGIAPSFTAQGTHVEWNVEYRLRLPGRVIGGGIRQVQFGKGPDGLAIAPLRREYVFLLQDLPPFKGLPIRAGLEWRPYSSTTDPGLKNHFKAAFNLNAVSFRLEFELRRAAR